VIFNADMTGEEEKLHLWPSPVFEQRQGSGMIYDVLSNRVYKEGRQGGKKT